MAPLDDRPTLTPAMRWLIPLGALLIFGGLASVFLFGGPLTWHHGDWVLERTEAGVEGMHFYRSLHFEGDRFAVDRDPSDDEPPRHYRIVEFRSFDEVIRLVGQPEHPGQGESQAMVICFQQRDGRLVLLHPTGEGGWKPLAVYRRR